MKRVSSGFLSRVLRHHPETADVTLGPGGWVDIDQLCKGIQKAGRRATRDDVEEIVRTNDKKRFTISEDGNRIRAAQGHSVSVDLDLPAVRPPAILLHGTARDNLDGIFSEGIQARGRDMVHLSTENGTAVLVGQRHGKPVVLRVNAQAMHDDGYAFYKADNGVWLTKSVPCEFISF
jgi:putative RNA 2'-phosphotransferase